MAKGGRILVIDDDPALKDMLYATLRAASYDVVEARSGEEALKILERYPPDLILVDIGLPGMDGFELTERLRENPFSMDAPILYITSFDKQTVEVEGATAGANFYVLKPFQVADLAADIYMLFASDFEAVGTDEKMFRVLKHIPKDRARPKSAPKDAATTPLTFSARPTTSTILARTQAAKVETPKPARPAPSVRQTAMERDSVELRTAELRELKDLLKDLREATKTLAVITERLSLLLVNVERD